MTQIRNHLYYGACMLVAILAALPPHVIHVFPTRYRTEIEGAVVLAAWAKSQSNLWMNPDGTPVKTAYVPKADPIE